MRRHLIAFTTITLLALPAQAGTILASVNGLVCAFCATGIEKTFLAQAAIQSVAVDLDKKLVTLLTKDTQDMDDATVTKLLTDAGFTVTNIERAP
jgi:copper chaperone CopZ